MSDAAKIIPALGVYAHYKGDLYEVIAIAEHHDSRETMVIYRSQKRGTLNVRPLIASHTDPDGWLTPVAATGEERFQLLQIHDVLPDNEYMALCSPGGSVFIKERVFFVSQGGNVDEWGVEWIPVYGHSVEDARMRACKLLASKGARPYDQQVKG